MTALIPEGLESLAVWDARDEAFWDVANPVFPGAIKWAGEHIERRDDTYRIEFYATDPPLAVVYRFKRDADGLKYQDPETGSIAVEPPAIVPLAELPPAHLLRG